MIATPPGSEHGDTPCWIACLDQKRAHAIAPNRTPDWRGLMRKLPGRVWVAGLDAAEVTS